MSGDRPAYVDRILKAQPKRNPVAYYVAKVRSCQALNFPHDHRIYDDHAECTVDRRTW